MMDMSQLKAKIANQFSRAAHRYDEMAEVQRLIGKDALDMMPKGGISLLDVGCGTGRMTYDLSQYFERSIGVDLSPGMIEYANASYSAHHPLQFNVADAERLPFASQTFDHVFSCMALQWCNPIGKSLQEIYRVMKQGGKGCIAVMCDGSLQELSDAWLSLGVASKVNQFETPEQLVKASIEAGFATFCEVKHYATYHVDILSLLGSIRHIGAGVRIDDMANAAITRRELSALQNVYLRQSDDTMDYKLPLTYQVCFLMVEKS